MRRRDSSGSSNKRRSTGGKGQAPSKRRSATASSKKVGETFPGKGKFRKDQGNPSVGKPGRSSGAEERSSTFDRKKKYTKPSGQASFRDRPGEEVQRSAAGFRKQHFKQKPGYRSTKKVVPTIASQTGKIRLNRYIANSGVCSRREADELIKMGVVSVNGKVITEMGYQVNPGDEVRYEDRVLRAEKPVYILMNKPKGYLTTTKDPEERNTVMHILGSAVKERIYPVGRLDRNTTGLLLFTNDGALAEQLSHPSYNVKKIYKVELSRPLTKNDFQKILDGVQLEEGRATVDDLAIISDDGKTIGIELHIGWNRVVRRIFEKLDYEVVKLDRSVYAGLDKKDLPRGHWRFLTKEEIVRLKHFSK